MKSRTKRTHFKYFEESLNSRRQKINCSETRPCKRMICGYCRLHRRSSFIRRGLKHIQKNELIKFVTISWPSSACIIDDKWSFLTSNCSWLSKTLSGNGGGPFIRVISLGEWEETPHIHYLLNLETSLLVRKIAKKRWPDWVVIQSKDIWAREEEGVLGYFFDQNFIPAQAHPARVKRTRVLSASRPMKCGFPFLMKAKPSPLKQLKVPNLAPLFLQSTNEPDSVLTSGN